MQITLRESLGRIRLYGSLAGVSIEGAMTALGHARRFRSLSYVRYAPESVKQAEIAACPRGADTVEKVI